MKYSNREDRKIRELVRSTAPYDSRKTIKNRYDVTRFVSKYASELGDGGDGGEDDNEVLDEVLDKYYTPDHTPTRDVMTEMGDTNKPGTMSLVSFGLMLLFIGFLLKS